MSSLFLLLIGLLFQFLSPGLGLSCGGGRNFCSDSYQRPRHFHPGMKLPRAELYETVFRGAIIVDGTGEPAFVGDLALTGERIVAVGTLNETLIDPEFTIVLQASKLYLTPGFIDSHTHDDIAVLTDPSHTMKTFQGVTTVVTGNCGFSSYPNGNSLELVREHLSSLLGPVHISNFHPDFSSLAGALRGSVGVNVASLVGHGPLRISVMGYENRAATDSEILVMQTLLDMVLSQGATGLSLGLVYPPSAYADERELIALADVVAKHDKVLTAHVRTYEGGLLRSVQEFLNILKASGAKGLLSHLQVAGKPYWNSMMDEAIQMITKAKGEGVDIAVDMYPYLAGSSTILQLLPPSSQAGGFDEFVEKLDDPDYILELRELTERGSEEGWESKVNLIGYENIVVGSVVAPELKIFEGKSLVEGAELLGVTEFDCLLFLIMDDAGQTNVIMFQQSQEDNNKVFQFQYQMVGSDSIPREGGKPHPRGYGSFPRVVGRMVRDRILDLELAVRKTTALPAARFGIQDRGLLQVGMKADLVLFGREFLDMNSYEDPTAQPEGIRGVWVNGVRVVEDGRGLSVFPGQVVNANN